MISDWQRTGKNIQSSWDLYKKKIHGPLPLHFLGQQKSKQIAENNFQQNQIELEEEKQIVKKKIAEKGTGDEQTPTVKKHIATIIS